MHNNYFFLLHLCREVSACLQGEKIISCFSQNKNELVLGTTSGVVPFIKADLDPAFSCLHFPDQYNRAKKNSVDLFHVLIGCCIEKAVPVKYDRSLVIYLENGYSLLFTMYGSRSNIALMKNGESMEWFKSAFGQKMYISQLKKYSLPMHDTFVADGGNIKKLFPVLGKQNIQYLAEKGYDNAGLLEKWELFTGVIKELESANTFTVESDNNNPVKLSLVNLMSEELKATHFNSPLEAINFFYVQRQIQRHLIALRNRNVSKISADLKRTNTALQKQKIRWDKLRNRNNYRLLADVLMANLHQLNNYRGSVVELSDFDGNPLTIKLVPGKSIAKIAENYYRKAKNQHIEIEKLEESIKRYSQELSRLEDLLDLTKSAENIGDIPELENGTKFKKKKSEFHEYEFMGYSIYVGRNSKNNDVLTFQYGTKNDLWLHVKDDKGSHVIVKQIPGSGWPERVIAYAAQIAAYYSSKRTDTLVPVIFTERKYVRKKKGLAPGAVIVEREEVLMVEPTLPE